MQIVTKETMDEYEEQYEMTRSAELPETPAVSSSSSSSSQAAPAEPVAPVEVTLPATTPAHRGKGRPKSSTAASAAKATEDSLDATLPSDEAVEEDPVDPEEIDGEGLPDQPALDGSDPYKFLEGDGPSPEPFTHIPVDTRDYKLNRFIDYEPGELVEYMLKEAHEDIVINTNRNAAEKGAQKTDYPEIMNFLGCLFQMTTVKLPQMKDYWYPGEGMREQGWGLPDFASRMSYDRFVELRQLLQFADYREGHHDESDAAWKVRPLIDRMKAKFQSIDRNPSQHLSVDEAMSMCAAERNPIKIRMDNKPIGCGFKFYVLVDYATKIVLDFEVEDNKYSGRFNKKDKPWGISGQRVLDLLKSLKPGHNYIIYTDTYYTSVALALELRKMGIGLIGTVKSDRLPVVGWIKIVNPGRRGNPKPGPAGSGYERGTVKTAHNETNTCWEFAVMDNGVVTFVDSVNGTALREQKERRLKGSVEKYVLTVPKGFVMYNKYKGGVDVFDQLRTGFYSFEDNGKTTKWNLRFYESMIGFATVQAYNVYRSLHPYGSPKHYGRGAWQSKATLWFWNNRFRVSRPLVRAFTADDHQSLRTPLGSSAWGSRNDLRLRGDCRGCKSQLEGVRVNRSTDFYCSTCLVFLHAECHNNFHSTLSKVGPVKPLDKLVALAAHIADGAYTDRAEKKIRISK